MTDPILEWPVDKVLDHGPPERRFNLVVLSEGFLKSEGLPKDDLSVYRAIVKDLVDELRLALPFRELWPLVNIYRIDVESSERGISTPSTGLFKNTFFSGSRPDGDSMLLACNGELVHKVCTKNVSPYHYPLVVMYEMGDGGTATGSIAMVTTGNSFFHHMVLHELGHSVFGLANEYDLPGDPARYTRGEPGELNVTTVTDPNRVKWRALATVPLKVVPNPGCNASQNDTLIPAGEVGLVEGAFEFHCGIYRPAGTCIMRDHRNDNPFCPVCQDQAKTKLRTFRPVTVERFRRTRPVGPLLAASLPLGGQPFVLLFDPQNGNVNLHEVSIDATVLQTTFHDQWNSEWTHFVPLALAGRTGLLLYKTLTGEVEIDAVAADGSTITTVWPSKWSLGWSSMTSFTLGGHQTPSGKSRVAPYLFSYKTSIGRFAIDKVADDGTGVTTVLDRIDPEFTGFSGFAALARWDPINARPLGGALLVGYRPITGTAALWFVASDGSSLKLLTTLQTMSLATAMVPLVARHELVFALYSAFTKEVRWLFAGDIGVDPSNLPKGITLAELGRTEWTRGWTAFAPFLLDGRNYWFAHKAGDGPFVFEPGGGTFVLDRID